MLSFGKPFEHQHHTHMSPRHSDFGCIQRLVCRGRVEVLPDSPCFHCPAGRHLDVLHSAAVILRQILLCGVLCSTVARTARSVSAAVGCMCTNCSNLASYSSGMVCSVLIPSLAGGAHFECLRVRGRCVERSSSH